MQNDNSPIVKGTTCFAEHQRYEVCCDEQECKHWVNFKKRFNCVLIAAQDGSRTQDEVGEFVGLTRMRVCQVERKIRAKLSEKSKHKEEGWEDLFEQEIKGVGF